MTSATSRLAAPSAAGDDEASDGELMAATARGDTLAFRVLVQRHAPAVYGYAYRFTGRTGEAEDVVQDVFLKLWTRAAEWRDGQGAMGGWLRRVTVNACIDRKRRRARLSAGDPPDRADQAKPADQVLHDRRLAQVAAEAVRRLPDRQRAAILLTYYQDLPNADAAGAMEMNLKAFESLLVRARKALSKLVAEAGVSGADLGGAS